MVTDGGLLALLGDHLAGDRLEGDRGPRPRIEQVELAAPAQRLPGIEVRHERGEHRVVGAHPALGLGAAVPPGRGEHPLRRRVHEHDVAARVGYQDRVEHRVEDQVEPVALGAGLRLGGAQLAIVLLDLLGGPAQVGDVAQDRDRAGLAEADRHRRAQHLEQEVLPLRGVDQQQLAAAGLGAFGVGEERGREEHVVQGDRAPPSLARPLVGREQHLGAGVGDQDPPVAIGQQDGIGHRVDDPEQPAPLALVPPLVQLDAAIPERRQADAEDLGGPADVLVERALAVAGEQEQAGAELAHRSWSARAARRGTIQSPAASRTAAGAHGSNRGKRPAPSPPGRPQEGVCVPTGRG